MTREEAIFTIEHRDGIMDYGETEQLAEALDMAIEALKAEPLKTERNHISMIHIQRQAEKLL